MATFKEIKLLVEASTHLDIINKLNEIAEATSTLLRYNRVTKYDTACTKELDRFLEPRGIEESTTKVLSMPSNTPISDYWENDIINNGASYRCMVWDNEGDIKKEAIIAEIDNELTFKYRKAEKKGYNNFWIHAVPLEKIEE